MQKFELAAEARGQILTVDVAPGLPAAVADLGMVERALTNLIDNAIRHTPEGTRITIGLRHQSGRVEVEVADTGPGVPAELRDGLFTRASALRHGARQGGGLGLVVVQRIVQLHGGSVSLAELPGKGAVFRFALPS